MLAYTINVQTVTDGTDFISAPSYAPPPNSPDQGLQDLGSHAVACLRVCEMQMHNVYEL